MNKASEAAISSAPERRMAKTKGNERFLVAALLGMTTPTSH